MDQATSQRAPSLVQSELPQRLCLTFALVVLALIYGYLWQVPVPPPEQLRHGRERFLRVDYPCRVGGVTMPYLYCWTVITIEGQPPFEYRGPHERLAQLRAGDLMDVWYLPPESASRGVPEWPAVWQIKTEARTVVSYEEAAAAFLSERGGKWAPV